MASMLRSPLINTGCKSFLIPSGCSDLLKVISAVLVMFSHYYNLKARTGYDLNVIEWCIRSQGGNVGVAVFFFLSGYGLMMSEMKSHLSLKMFFKKRFCKIYLPVLLITALWLPICYKITPPHSYSLIISDLLWSFKDPVLWFIKSLLLLYGTFYLSTLYLKKKQTLSLAVLWSGTVITCIISYFSNGTFGLNSISGIPLFAVGVVSALWSLRKFMGIHPAFVALFFSFIAISLTMSFFPRFIPNLAHVIADYLVVATIILIFSQWHPIVKIPVIFSMITFDIYLVHLKILVVMQEVTPTLPILLFVVATLLFALTLNYLRRKLIRMQ